VKEAKDGSSRQVSGAVVGDSYSFPLCPSSCSLTERTSLSPRGTEIKAYIAGDLKIDSAKLAPNEACRSASKN
jgi:hypothetical protein